MEQNNKKIIISIKVNVVNPLSLASYSPHGNSNCFEVYKMLLNNYITVYNDDIFIKYLKGIKFTNQVGKEVSIFPNDIDPLKVFDNDNFKNWIAENTNNFIIQLINTNDKHLIRKHKTEEIYVVPVQNETFNVENVKYTEALIKVLKQKGDDIWLLLHDKDIYDSNYPYHKADISEFDQGHVVNNFSELKTLIVNNRVFTFIHQESDHFYSEVIKKLDKLTLDDIIKELEMHKRVAFANKVAKIIRKDDMISVVENACETYDFSKQFLEL